MPDWNKVTATRAAAAAKALELLVNTADPRRGYDVHQDAARAMLEELETKLETVRQAYRDKAGVTLDRRPAAPTPAHHDQTTREAPAPRASTLEEPRAIPAFVQAIDTRDLPTWILHLTNRLVEQAEELRP